MAKKYKVARINIFNTILSHVTAKLRIIGNLIFAKNYIYFGNKVVYGAYNIKAITEFADHMNSVLDDVNDIREKITKKGDQADVNKQNLDKYVDILKSLTKE